MTHMFLFFLCQAFSQLCVAPTLSGLLLKSPQCYHVPIMQLCKYDFAQIAINKETYSNNQLLEVFYLCKLILDKINIPTM